MKISPRFLLLDRDGALCRMPNRTFFEILDDPLTHRFPAFAGFRARTADVFVELRNRRPFRVIRTICSFMAFDEEGHFEHGAFARVEHALLEQALSKIKIIKPGLDAADATSAPSGVHDATDAFVARGGRWRPTKEQLAVFHSASLGHTKCKRMVDVRVTRED